jgi:hypothetical protein
MTFDWTRELFAQFDLRWNLAHGPSLDTLTDEEYLWEPVPGCWSIRPTGPGGRGEIEQVWRTVTRLVRPALPVLVNVDQDDAGEDERAAGELPGGRQLAQQQPGVQDREEHLGNADERGSYGPEPAGGGDAGNIGDHRRDQRQFQHRHDPAEVMVKEFDVAGVSRNR